MASQGMDLLCAHPAVLADTLPKDLHRGHAFRPISQSSIRIAQQLVPFNFQWLNTKDGQIFWTDVDTRSSSPDNSSTVSTDTLKAIEDEYPLPDEHPSRLVRFLRYKFFSVYRRIFTIVFVLNLIALALFLSQLKKHGSVIPTYAHASTAAAANICAAILMRNEHVVNLLFRVACCLPHSAPLSIRRRMAKIYSYGGVHSACGVAATLWYLAYSGLLLHGFITGGEVQIGLAVTTGMVLALLVLILIFAHPYLRMRLHDHFERIHRFAGWTAVGALWAQMVLSVQATANAANKSFGEALITVPPFWFLIVITCCIIYPWLRLRRRSVEAEKLSKYATRLHFDYSNMETCVGVRLTDSALKETHAFATIPNRPDEEKGFSVLISNAGDWTNKVIHNAPKKLWVRGAPTIGVMRISLCFKKVVVIATGSGIGPCLSFLQARPDYPARVIWSASAPEQNYGDEIVNAVFRADDNAIIVDTKKTGRPNLLALAYGMYKSSEAEAVVIISNPMVTGMVVCGLESRGVPTFGAIFDS